VDGFEGNPSNLRGLRIGIDASIWFFHAAYGREGENPELRTLFFRCARLTSAPFLPIFIFDGPKRPKFKRGKKISGEKHWLVDSMKGIIEAFGFEWRMVRSPLIVFGTLLIKTLPVSLKGPWRSGGRAGPPE
jgi:Holliday junction resolvase YEN1